MKNILLFFLLTAVMIMPLAAFGQQETAEEPEKVEQGGEFSVLAGFDLASGDEVDASILLDHSVTLINLWATTCPACINKLPQLEQLSRQLPEGAGILGIVVDGEHRSDDAREILEMTGVGFLNINPSRTMFRLLQRTAPYVPATVIVDSGGNVVYGPHYGGQDIETYMRELEKHL